MSESDARLWQPDRALFLLVVALVLIGWASVFSATTALAMDRGLWPFHFLIKQVIAALIGLAAMRLMLNFDYKILAQPRIYMPIVLIAVLLLVLVLFMPSVNKTHRWFRLPLFSVQPSELAKPALIIALAAVAWRWREMMESWGFIFLTLAVFVIPVIFLIAIEPDLGTAAVLALISLAILFAGGIGLRKLLILFLVVLICVSIFISVSPYRLNRILAFLDPTSDPLGAGFQSLQSEIALGAGGLTGVGYMESRQKFFYLPAAESDFIFSVIGEEWGLAGTIIVLALFLALFARGLRIAFTARDFFGFLLAVGVTTMLVGQALMNVSVATTLFPTKGIPLPFISYGGSSLVVSMASVGLLLNVSQYCRRD